MELSLPALANRIPTEADAYTLLEEMRWHGKPVCPHCGSIDKHYFLKPRNGISRETSCGNQTQRRLWKCSACRMQFSVLTGTVMHGTKIPVRTWLFVAFEFASSKNGVAAREIERKYRLHGNSAWTLCHRLREAMRLGPYSALFVGTVLPEPVPRRVRLPVLDMRNDRRCPYGGDVSSVRRATLGCVVVVLQRRHCEQRLHDLFEAQRIGTDRLVHLFRRRVLVRHGQ